MGDMVTVILRTCGSDACSSLKVHVFFSVFLSRAYPPIPHRPNSFTLNELAPG